MCVAVYSNVVILCFPSTSTECLYSSEIDMVVFCRSQVFERETHREKILEGRRREIKLKAKQASAASGGGGVVAGGGGGGG